MSTITVLKFDTEGGADKALDVMQSLAKQQLFTLYDVAITTWPTGMGKPKIKQVTNLTGDGTLDSAFWGMLFGLTFSTPLSGASTDIPAGFFTNVGIGDDFIKLVREKVIEGTSALCMVTSDGVLDRISEVMQDVDFELVSSSLSKQQDAQLKAAFIHE